MAASSDLPPGLPVPADDGSGDGLPGRPMPALALPATTGEEVALDGLAAARSILYAYPLAGGPGHETPAGWDAIPGARGCTPEACGFRDHHADLAAAGAARVFGLSVQDLAEQRELVDRLHLPFPMLSDPGLRLAAALGLPTFAAAGRTLYRRLTLVVTSGAVEHVFYPVFPPDAHAGEVLAWLAAHPS